MNKYKIAIIGLGYVGIPLARLLATKYPVVGYDINFERVKDLKSGFDSTLELDEKTLNSVLVDSIPETNGLFCSNNINDIKNCNYFIITVPTPVDANRNPVLKPLINASKTVGSVIKKGDVVIYESTVYPGTTEEVCVPELEKVSGLKFNEDFFAGYSPERINPGDKNHTVENILKVTSGSNHEIAKKIDYLYNSVITAGTHMAPSIKVAEAAKVIENSQRDINIAFVNELAKIFNLLEIDTQSVLEAASTKWNFLPFKPGLVGGHCIGVDPYYLAHKAIQVGYNPEIILSGRRLNDSMGVYVGKRVEKLMNSKKIEVSGSNILVMGITFKENCPDIRNTKVIDIINYFTNKNANVYTYDPWADPGEVYSEYKLKSTKEIVDMKYDAIVLAVAHSKFENFDFPKIITPKTIIYDVKGLAGDIANEKL